MKNDDEAGTDPSDFWGTSAALPSLRLRRVDVGRRSSSLGSPLSELRGSGDGGRGEDGRCSCCGIGTARLRRPAPAPAPSGARMSNRRNFRTCNANGVRNTVQRRLRLALPYEQICHYRHK